jgi:hypothetical protein
MKRAAFNFILLFLSAYLTACSRENREKDLKECTTSTQRQWSQEQSVNGAFSGLEKEERRDAIGGMIAACMESRGYRHDGGAMIDERCVDDVDYNPYCYRRDG